MLRGRSKEELATLAEEIITAYGEGQELHEQALRYNTSKRTLERLLLTIDPLGWLTAQSAKWWVMLEDIQDDTSPKGWRERNRIAFRLDRIEGHIARYKSRIAK